jgi:hypothetical protein
MINIICLKHGTKYGPEYVNKLYNMISRHLTLPHNFYCFTEDPGHIDPQINIKPLPNGMFSGWWWKPYIFKQGHFPDGDINLFFDLDMVIVGNIDKLVSYLPNEFIGLEDVGRVFRRTPQKLGSAVLKWPSNQYSNIWDEIESNPEKTRQFPGDQDWIWYLHRSNIKFFPESWIKSYKWEIRTRDELIRVQGKNVFKTVRDPILDPECSVIAFHGTPNPEDVQDPIIVDNWR